MNSTASIVDKNGEKSVSHGFGAIVFIIVLAISVLLLLYYLVKRNKDVIPDKQGVYHAKLGSPQYTYPINIDVPANKFGTLALNFIVLLISGVGLFLLSIYELKNTMPIYIFGIMFLLTSCKLCLIDIKKIKEVIGLI